MNNYRETECYYCGKKRLCQNKNKPYCNTCYRKFVAKNKKHCLSCNKITVLVKGLCPTCDIRKRRNLGFKERVCVVCNEKRRGLIDIHHLDNNHNNNNKENLICLCANCHRALHYGHIKL